MNKKTIGIGLTLFALFAVGLAFGQTAQQASQFVNRLKSIASDFERLARDSRYNDAKTADLYESVQRKYNDWAADYQRFLDAGGGGNFTSKQVDDINAAVQKVMNAVQTIETNVTNGSQTRPTKWNIVVRYKYNRSDSETFTEEVTVNAASLDEAKEKAIRSLRYTFAYPDSLYIVDARVK
jgi:hypothetical protein